MATKIFRPIENPVAAVARKAARLARGGDVALGSARNDRLGAGGSDLAPTPGALNYNPATGGGYFMIGASAIGGSDGIR